MSFFYLISFSTFPGTTGQTRYYAHAIISDSDERGQGAVQSIASQDADLLADLRQEGEMHVAEVALANVLQHSLLGGLFAAGHERECRDAIRASGRFLITAVDDAITVGAGEVQPPSVNKSLSKIMMESTACQEGRDVTYCPG